MVFSLENEQNCLGKEHNSKMIGLHRIPVSWVKRSGNWTSHSTTKWAEIEPKKVVKQTFIMIIFY